MGLGHHPWIGRVDAVDIGIDVAAIGLKRRCECDGAGVGAAAAERRDAVSRRDPLESRDHGDLAVRHPRS